jgi:hypothetical protein
MDLFKGLGINIGDEFQKDLEDVMGEVESSAEENAESSEEALDAASNQETDEDTVEDGEGSEPEESDSEDDSEEAEEDESAADDDIEIVATKDGKKVKIDYSDRDRIKKAHLLARQGRIWQSERDNALKEIETLREHSSSNDEVLNALEEAKDDIPELFRLITGGEDWDAMIEEEIRQREEIAQLTPEQLNVYNKHKLNERRDRELARREAEWEKKLQEAEDTRTKADQDTQRALINGAFNEYRFHGQLSDKNKEHKLDQMVWNNVVRQIDGKDLSESEVREFIKREFDVLRSSIIDNTKKKAVSTKRKKVAKATKKAAAAATKVSHESSFDDLVNNGDVAAILSDPNWMDKIDKY